MSEKLSRRDFITGTLGLIATSGFAVSAERFAQPEIEIPQNLTYEQAMGDAIHFATLLNQIPEENRVGIKTDEDLAQWTMEIVPYFEYENIVEDTDEVNGFVGLQIPPMKFEEYMDGLRSHHVLGTTEIFGNNVTLNARIANPVSPWYGREDSIGTLVHELAHAQGVKFPAPGSNLDHESSAQLIALEVMAAMVNNGNELVIPALLDELKTMNLQAARFLALRDNRMDEFMEDRDKVLTDPLEQANAAKSDRQWGSYEDEKKFPYILEAYNYRPMNAVYRGMHNHDQIPGVKMPINWMQDMINDSSASSAGSYYPEATPRTYEPGMYAMYQEPQPLHIDDLHYFYDHADVLAQAVGNEKS